MLDHYQQFHDTAASLSLFEECASDNMLITAIQNNNGQQQPNGMFSSSAEGIFRNLDNSNVSSFIDWSSTSTTSSSSAVPMYIFNDKMLSCIGRTLVDLASKDVVVRDEVSTWMMIITGSIVFFMQTGFAMVCAGCVRRKNLQNTMLKNLLDMVIAAITFYTVGYAFAYGGQTNCNNDNNTNNNNNTTTTTDTCQVTTFIGTTNFFSVGLSVDEMASYFYRYTLSATCVTIVAGTIAERCQMIAYIFYCIVLTTMVFPIIVHSIWNEYGMFSIYSAQPLHGIGVIDLSGSGVIHVTGGTAALLATYLLGPRTGRFTNSKGNTLHTPKKFRGSSVALQLLGTFILWFGWYGFNAGSTLLLNYREHSSAIATRAIMNTLLGGSMGCIFAVITNMYTKLESTGDYMFDLTISLNGALSGLVAITASCGCTEDWAAAIIGSIAGFLYVVGSNTLIKYHIDDVVDGIPVHFANGIWGMIATGLFASPHPMKLAYNTSEHVGFFYEIGRYHKFDVVLLGNQILAVLFIITWTTVWMLPLFLWLHRMNWFRTGSMDEIFGLDLKYHGNQTAEAKIDVEEEIAIYQEQQLLLEEKQNSNHRSSIAKKRSRSSKSRSRSRSRNSMSSSKLSSAGTTTTTSRHKLIAIDSEVTSKTNPLDMSKLSTDDLKSIESFPEFGKDDEEEMKVEDE